VASFAWRGAGVFFLPEYTHAYTDISLCAPFFFSIPGKDLQKRALGSCLVFSVAGYLTVTYHSLSRGVEAGFS
jgi:hypothetical protein